MDPLASSSLYDVRSTRETISCSLDALLSNNRRSSTASSGKKPITNRNVRSLNSRVHEGRVDSKSPKNIGDFANDPKKQTWTPKFTKNDFSETSMFAIHPLRKPQLLSPQQRNFGSEIDKKVTWKQSRTKIQFRAS